MTYPLPNPLDEPIDVVPADAWRDLADIPADRAVILSARCVDLAFAEGIVTARQHVDLYAVIAAFANTWLGDWRDAQPGAAIKLRYGRKFR